MDQLVALLREQLAAAEERADAAEERADAAEERADRERRRADRAVDRANQRIDELSRNLRQTNHNLEETNRNLVQTNRNLDDTNTQLNRTNNLLEWKSLTSTKNPPKIELTHKFLITAGRKRYADDGIVHVSKEGRRQITRHEVPHLNEGEFVRVNFHSRQERTIDDALKLRERQREWELQRGYMGNGIDFRQNVKAEVKRRYQDDEVRAQPHIKRIKMTPVVKT